MKREQAEALLSRSLDGELSASEAALLARYRQDHPELNELELAWREAGRMLHEPVKPPVTAEAAWQDVRRRIRMAGEGEGARAPVFGWRLGWAAAMITLLLLGFASVAVFQLHRGTAPTLAKAGEEGTQVEYVETDLPGASPMVYQDAESGWMVIWVAGLDDKQGT